METTHWLLIGTHFGIAKFPCALGLHSTPIYKGQGKRVHAYQCKYAWKENLVTIEATITGFA
jgi:hypothetical protein